MKKILVIVTALLIFTLSFTSCGGLNENEKTALDCAKQLQAMLGDEEPLTLYEGVTVIKASGDDWTSTYVVIPYSGSTFSGQAIFVDGSYLMDANDYVPTDGSTENLDKLIVLRNIKLAEDYGFEVINIDHEKLMKAMK